MARRRSGEWAGAARRAATFVEAHAERALSVDDIASACGLHVRTLYRRFSQEFQVTPKRYLRQCRLERIRLDLSAAARGTTVTTVAIRHGVTHLGRFSREYAVAFGEPPSATLRRSIDAALEAAAVTLAAPSTGREDARVA